MEQGADPRASNGGDHGEIAHLEGLDQRGIGYPWAERPGHDSGVVLGSIRDIRRVHRAAKRPHLPPKLLRQDQASGDTVTTVDELSSLLMRAKEGDEYALAAFVHATQAPIWRFCAHLVGPDDADDAAQETFLAAWRALQSFRGDASAKTWLFVIARRSAERVARRHRRWLELADGAPGPRPPSRPESATVLGELLSELEMERRVALVLTQIIGLSYAETAAVCECPIGTIRSRVARAREELLRQRSTSHDAEGFATS